MFVEYVSDFNEFYVNEIKYAVPTELSRIVATIFYKHLVPAGLFEAAELIYGICFLDAIFRKTKRNRKLTAINKIKAAT